MPLFKLLWPGLLLVVSLGAFGAAALPVRAACTLVPAAGNTTYICDSGTAPSLVDLLGDNTLTLPEGGSGTITGAVTFGGGADSVVVRSGSIGGMVSQGSGIDDFIMTGGRIQSLQQGDGYDTFNMSAGTIVGAFEDGDFARMSGGTIGRIDFKLANNFFYLSGGEVLGNVVAGFGDDTVEVSGGSIGGNLSLSGGADAVTITDGTIKGEIRLSFGDDRLIWDGGGTVGGAILMAQDQDTASLRNLDESILKLTPRIDGGTATDGDMETDRLTFVNTNTANGSRYVNWETVELTDGSDFRLADTLRLGDAMTATGSLDIDTTSRIIASGDAAISPFTAGALAGVSNAGIIYLAHDDHAPADRLTIMGDYFGAKGSIVFDTALGDDASLSDRLIISGGTASGLTGIAVVNADGAGAATLGDGILLIEAISGGMTLPGAFVLDRSVAAGAYEYLLFRGGLGDGTEQNWYLRNAVIAVPPAPGDPDPVDPAPVDPVPDDPDDPTDNPAVPPPVDVVPPSPGAPAVPLSPVAPTEHATPATTEQLTAQGALPLYRIETPNYAVVAPAADLLVLETLSTFHDRRGEQQLLADSDGTTAWVRMLGEGGRAGWSGTVAPSLDGRLVGVEAGIDLLSISRDGHTTEAGLYGGYSQLSGAVRGFALGWNNFDTGTLVLGGANAGAYATHVGPEGWYIEGVAQATLFDGSIRSTRGTGIDISGAGFAASLEGGYPLHLPAGWTFEPQAQIIWQSTGLNGGDDGFSSVVFDRSSGFTGRLGARLYNRIETEFGFVQPELMANLWHDFAGEYVVNLGDSAIATRRRSSYVELGAGISAELSDTVSVFARGSYSFDIAGPDRSISEGRLGLQVKF